MLFKGMQKRLVMYRICIVLAGFTCSSILLASPQGGTIVGGSGSINTSGLTTTIRQNTQSQVINWNSYNVNANETVNYLQPNTSAISLNHILSNNASQIFGKINANGQVVLVNPNGIFFNPGSSVNVGGLVASGLDISPTDFMNGDYLFNAMEGTDGLVVNQGLIQASLGGNVGLIGQQIINEGVISAQLGAVVLAAGKEAVLTFDNEGLIGVRVSKAVLQDEVGVDPSVLNSGEITSESGRVLLTSSISRDVFSGAVNSGGMEHATSVVVNEDGSFTLGVGGNTTNTGTIDVSGSNNAGAGKAILLGENIDNAGDVLADSLEGDAGFIELHANDKVELSQEALISAQANGNGIGGQIQILGNKVGLFDTAQVDASGKNSGGDILVGGDQQGLNGGMRNAEFLYLGENTVVRSNATDIGDGGRIIAYADDTARIYGELSTRGGENGGNGGFIETSGKQGFEISSTPDISASTGAGGLWLIDPYSIIIDYSNNNYQTDTTYNPYVTTYTSDGSSSHISVNTIKSVLDNGDVEIITGTGSLGAGNIDFNASLNIDSTTVNGVFHTLTLDAYGDITFRANTSIADGTGSGDSINLHLYANGAIDLNNARIDTNGGEFIVGGGGGNTPTSFTSTDIIDTSGGWLATNGGEINIATTTGNISVNNLITDGYAVGDDNNGAAGGKITLSTAGSITVNGDISASGSNGVDGGHGSEFWSGGNGGAIDITSTGSSIDINGTITNNGGDADGDGGQSADGGTAGSITLTSQASAGSIELSDFIISSGGAAFGAGSAGSGGAIKLVGSVTADSVPATATSPNTLDNTLYIQGASLESGVITATGPDGGDAYDLQVVVSDSISITGITANGGNAMDSNGHNGGDVVLTGASITGGKIDTSGSDGNGADRVGGTGGAIDLNAVENADVQSVQINGDLISQGGQGTDSSSQLNGVRNTSGAVTIDLENTGNPGGSITITHTANFTSGLVITGSSGTDTLKASDRANTWDITNYNVGTLNGNVSFSAIENLSGGDHDDDFKFNDANSIVSGVVSGNAFSTNGDSIDLTGSNISTIKISTSDNSSSNEISVNGIETLTGHTTDTNTNANTNTLVGADTDNTWRIDGTDGGALSSTFDLTTSIPAGPTEGVTKFTIFANLSGGTGADNFIVEDTGLITGTIDGASGTGVDQVTNVRTAVTYWASSGTAQGTVNNADNTTQFLSFSGIENLTGGSNDDHFDFTSGGSIGNINGNGGNNSLTGHDASNTFTLSAANAGDVADGVGTYVTTFTAIQTLNGSSTVSNTDTLIAFDNDNTWLIDSTGGGSITDTNTTSTLIAFTEIENLTGGSTDDHFDFTLGGSIGDIDGNGGSNSLTGHNASNDFTLTSANSGNVAENGGSIYVTSFTDIQILHGSSNVSNTDTLIAFDNDNTWVIDSAGGGTITDTNTASTLIAFTEMENITGSTGTDIFNLTTGSLNGLLDGGAGISTDIVNITNSAVNTVAVITTDTGYDLTITNIEDVTGNGGVTSELIANNQLNEWTITGGTGQLNGMDFQGFRSLVGGSDEDDFIGSAADFNDANWISIDAGAGNDYVDVSQSAVGSTLDLSIFTLNTSIASIEGLLGASGLILKGTNFDTTWMITGTNSGTLQYIDSGSGAVDWLFKNFTNLTGGTGIDTFNLTTGSLTGLLDGGTGSVTDVVNITNAAIETVAISSTDTASDLTVTNIESINSHDGTASELVAMNQGNLWTIDGVDSGNLNGTDFSGFKILTGSAAIDTFDLTADFTGTLNGLGDNDVFNVNTIIVSSIALNGGGDTGDRIFIGLASNVDWRITGTDAGDLSFDGGNTYPMVFSGIKNLTGGSGTDTFDFMAGITGVVTGAAGADTFQISADGLNLLNLVGGPDSDTVADLTNTSNSWNITNTNEGNLNSNGSTSGVIFYEVENLTGSGDANDDFTIVNAGSISGEVRGGTGTGTDQVINAHTAGTAWTITGNHAVTISATDFTGIENLVGSNSQIDTFNLQAVNAGLVIDGGTNTTDEIVNQLSGTMNWTISGPNPNSGSVSGNAFSDIENLTGSDNADDNFTLTDNGSISGTVSGGAGTGTDNVINTRTATTAWNITGANMVTVASTDFTGIEGLVGSDSQIDTFNLQAVNGGLVIDGGTDTTDEIVNQLISTTSWTINGPNPNSGSVSGNTFSDIENLTGSDNADDNFTLADNGSISGTVRGGVGTGTDQVINARTSTTDWAITGANAVTVSNTDFSGIEELTGSDTQTDTFRIQAVNGSLNLHGGSNSGDEIINELTASTNWTINGADSGSVSTNNFDNIENLTGADNVVDNFIVTNSGSISGTIDGGTGIDTLDLESKTTDVTVKLGQTFIASAINTFNIENFEFVKGPDTEQNTVNSTIIGADLNQLWIIDDLYGGAVGSVLLTNDVIPIGGAEGISIFSGFKKVVGGTADDTFRGVNGGYIPDMDGGDENTGDMIDLSLQDYVSITIGSDNPGSTNTTGIEGYRGNNTNSFLIASNDDNLWTISGENDGTVEYGTGPNAESFAFTDFNILRGGNLDDTFIVQSGGSVQGISTNDNSILTGIYAGDGDDTLTVNFVGIENGAVALFDGEAGSNSVTFQNTAGGIGFDRAVYTPVINNVQATHSFENYANGALVNGYSVTYQNATNAVNDNVSADTLMINGTSVGDNLALGASSFQVSSGAVTFTEVGYTGKNSIVVNGGNGSDSVELTSAIDLGINDLTISAESIINDNTDLITANTLTLDTLSSLSSTLRTNVINLAITNSTDSNAVLNIEEQNDIALNSLGLVGRLNLTADGAITQNSPLANNASINLISTSNTGFIDLSLSGNALTGPLTFTTAGAVDLDNTVVTNLAGVASASLSVVSNNQEIFGTGNMLVSSAEFNAGTTGSIQLDSAGNDFGVITILSAETVIIRDSNDIQLGNVNMGTAAGTGMFSLTSTGVSQQSGSVFTQQAGPGLTAGQITFDAGAGSIALNGANQFVGEVSLNNTGNHAVSINDVDNLVFTDSAIGSGAFTVTSGGGVSQTGFITQETGATAVNIHAGAGAISLSDPGNSFTGDITLSNSGSNLVNLVNSNAINLASVITDGSLDIRSLGSFDITQTGALSVSGNASFTVDAGQSILLDLVDLSGNPQNHFSQQLSMQSNNGGALQSVQVSNDTNVNLATDDISGDLFVLSNGAVTQSGAWIVAGDAVIDSNGASVTLSEISNDFNQLALVDALDAVITESNGVTLGTSSQSNSISGDFTVTTISGNILDNVNTSMTVGGSFSASAGSGSSNLMLDSVANDFNVVNIVSVHDAVLSDTNSIEVNSSNIYGNLEVIALGSINDGSSGLQVTGTSSFTAGNLGSVILDHASNTLSGQINILSSGTLAEVNVNNTVSSQLSAINVSNNLTLTSQGDIRQVGGFNVGGATQLTSFSNTSGNHDIILGEVNSLNSLDVPNAHNVTINNATNNLLINELNATGAVNIISGNLTTTQSVYGNGITFSSSTGSTNITQGMVSTGSIDVTAGDIIFNGDITADGGLSLTTNNANLTQNGNLYDATGDIALSSAGTISMTGNAAASASNGDIQYSAQGDIFTKSLTANGNTVSLISNNGEIVDSNGADNNVIAGTLNIRAVQGIGDSGNPVNTQVAVLDVINSGIGSVYLDQIGAINIKQLQAASSGQRIEFDSNADIRLEPGSLAVNRDNGVILMTTDYGSILQNGVYDLQNANITANQATFFAINGDFGVTGYPLVVDIPKSGSLFVDARRNNIRYYPEKPDNLRTTGLDVSSLGVLQAISGEQLVEIESLSDVDPAIFTELRNYSLVDVSIRMPRDQLYEDELEEEEKLLQAM